MMTAFVLPGGAEIWIILIIALLLFGHRIPGMARSLGSGIVEFKKGLRGGDDKETLPPPSSSDQITGGASGGDQATQSQQERHEANT